VDFASLLIVDAIETLRVIHFDRRRTVLSVFEYAGEPTRVLMPLRAIIGDALSLGSAGLLLSHNHPSGDPTPSRQDVAATRQLAQAAQALGIRVHDHIVTGGQQSISFRALGLL
jgi:DNA repair protein RadC